MQGLRDPGADLNAQRVNLGRWDVNIGPLHYVAAERVRLDRLSWQSFDVQPLGATIGGVVEGLDLAKDLHPSVIAELRRALLDFKVLFFRSQHITSAQQVAFAQRFGELELHPFIPANPEHPYLVRFAKSADVGGYENVWHSDVSWREIPSMGAVLRALEVPSHCGDTLFSDMYAAYEGLDEDMRNRIAGLTAVHDFSLSFGKQVPSDMLPEMQRKYPAVTHPVVRTHEETQRRLLYVNRIFVDHIADLPESESTALLDTLCRQAEIVEHQCRWAWEPGSIAFWDNRAVQHYACSDYWPSARVMERASIVGRRPLP
jgi:alpha-ketoglutarate-dependent sulfate ester dioxygenase